MPWAPHLHTYASKHSAQSPWTSNGRLPSHIENEMRQFKPNHHVWITVCVCYTPQWWVGLTIKHYHIRSTQSAGSLTSRPTHCVTLIPLTMSIPSKDKSPDSHDCVNDCVNGCVNPTQTSWNSFSSKCYHLTSAVCDVKHGIRVTKVGLWNFFQIVWLPCGLLLHILMGCIVFNVRSASPFYGYETAEWSGRMEQLLGHPSLIINMHVVLKP